MDHRAADQLGNFEGTMPALWARGCGLDVTQGASFLFDAMTMSAAQTCLIDAQVAEPIGNSKAHRSSLVPGAPELHASAFAMALMGSNRRSQSEAEMQDHDDR